MSVIAGEFEITIWLIVCDLRVKQSTRSRCHYYFVLLLVNNNDVYPPISNHLTIDAFISLLFILSRQTNIHLAVSYVPTTNSKFVLVQINQKIEITNRQDPSHRTRFLFGSYPTNPTRQSPLIDLQ